VHDATDALSLQLCVEQNNLKSISERMPHNVEGFQFKGQTVKVVSQKKRDPDIIDCNLKID